jgi:copper chaperone CopZ
MLLSAKLAFAALAALFGGATLCGICDPATGSGIGGPPQPALEVAADTATVNLAIKGMTCGSCATTARVVLRRVPGVYHAEVSFDSASAVVRYDPARTSPDVLIAQLRRMTGYEASVIEPAAARRSS